MPRTRAISRPFRRPGRTRPCLIRRRSASYLTLIGATGRPHFVVLTRDQVN